MCADFFREYPGLYSRVVPVYNKVENGSYDERYMSRRPKQHMQKSTRRLLVKFLPEGGNSVQGVKNTIAFEATDQDGQAVDVEGKLADGTTVKTDYMGRGVFSYTPSDTQEKISFKWEGKEYSFKLPKAGKQGVVLHYDHLTSTATVNAVGIKAAAYAVLCRGRLQKFQRLNGESNISLKDIPLPTGINDIVIYDADAHPLASRLFFVNNHDMGTKIDMKMTTDAGEVGVEDASDGFTFDAVACLDPPRVVRDQQVLQEVVLRLAEGGCCGPVAPHPFHHLGKNLCREWQGPPVHGCVRYRSGQHDCHDTVYY